MRRAPLLPFLALGVVAAGCSPQAEGAAGSRLDLLRLPSGFSVALYAEAVPGARSMTISPGGVLYVGTRGGEVWAVLDRDGDRRGEQVLSIASGLNMPNGVAFRDGSLYVAEVHRVIRFDGIEGRLANPPAPVVVRDTFPQERAHGWKYLRFGPDGKLYVPVGAPCNICEPKDPYAALSRMDADGSNLEVFARGIRNTVGFDWHPTTKELWFTDNGRDFLGDEVPPDELNRAPTPGLHFGYPYCHGGNIIDPEFGRKRNCSEFTPPAQNLGPHVASLGARFYDGKMFPAEYRHQLFIAEHGSWNRSRPIGYRVTLIRLAADGRAVKSYEPFLEGWLQEGGPWGRPVDILFLPDGSMLVSDDHGGAIFRVTYGG